MKKDMKYWLAKTRDFCRPNNKVAYTQFISTLIIYLGLLSVSHFLIYTYGFSWWIFVPVLAGLFLVRLFAIQHDCMHESFVGSKKQNKVIAFLLSWYTHVPSYAWKVSHKFHHNHNMKIELTDIGDVKTLTVEEYSNRSPVSRLRYRIFRFAMVCGLAGIVYILWYQRIPMSSAKNLGVLSDGQAAREWKKIKEARYSFWLTNACLVLFYGIGCFFLGWSFVITQLLVVCIFAIFAVWFFYVQHQYEDVYKSKTKDWSYLDAALHGSSHYKLPRIFNYFTCNIGLHFIHHLNERVPNYELRNCYLAHKEDFDAEVHTLTLKTGLKSMFLHLYDDGQKKMVSFRSLKRNK